MQVSFQYGVTTQVLEIVKINKPCGPRCDLIHRVADNAACQRQETGGVDGERKAYTCSRTLKGIYCKMEAECWFESDNGEEGCVGSIF